MDGDDRRATPLLAGLNGAQERAVTTDAAPLAILAGAGSGKTRVLTRRIARRVTDGDIDATHVLAVTFTRKAASELRTRLGTLGLPSAVHAGTFHSIAFAQLRQRWQERGITPPSVLDRKVGFVARLVRSRGSRQRGGGASSTLPLDLVSEIEWAKARMITAEGYPAESAAAGRRPPIDAEQVADVFARYEEEKLTRRMVDFDDLLRLATRDLRVDEPYAAARRWRFRHLFVDEFQDVNPLQFELLRAWLGDRSDLCVVGDPNQAIYSWNGADASYLAEFGRHFPGAETITLTENYRSSPQILGVANTILATGPRSTVFQLRPNRGDGPIPTVRSFADEQAEARAIARRLRDHHAPGRPWSEQAVLVRTNAQLAVIEEALRSAHVPFRSRGAGRLLDQPEVRDALGSLRRGPGELRERLDEIEATLDLDDVATGATSSGDPPVATLNDERTANVAELVRLGREYLGLDAGGTASSFGAWLTATLGSEDGGPSADAVDLATFHAAKGLEWAVVHLAGLEEGFVPIHHVRTEPARAEELRLLYVGLTRAEKVLHCTWAERRTFASRSVPRRASPHLESISLAIDLLGDGEMLVDLVDAVARQRAVLRADDGVGTAARRRPTRAKAAAVTELTPADQQLFEELKVWRRAQAKLADVPAFVVFSDATLAELARTRPSSSAQLLDVNGIGAVKAQRFGTSLLDIVAAAAAKPSTTSSATSPSARGAPRGAGRSGRGRGR